MSDTTAKAQAAPPTAGAVAAAAPTAAPALRIFLSYGHDEFKPLADRLVQDLRARKGYEVWFDESQLHAGRDWEMAIDQGLAALSTPAVPGRMVLLMTPHSVRVPEGYCLNELERALDQHVPVIPVTVETVAAPLSICRLQRLDMRGCTPVDLHPGTYEQRFKQLCDAIDNLSLAQDGEEGRLRRALEPGAPDGALHYHLPRFTGRQWVWQAFDAWLARADAPQVLLITGAPGGGKSAIAAWLAEHRPDLRALHACWHAEPGSGDPRTVVRSLAWQLSTQLPAVFDHLAAMPGLEDFCHQASAEQLFNRLLVDVMHSIDPPAQPLVVLIDGLDAASVGGTNPLADLLGAGIPRLPAWLRFVLTGEPTPAVTAPLQAWPALDLAAGSEDNLRDVGNYIRLHLAPLLPQGEPLAAVQDRLTALSEGNWLYLENLWAALAHGQLTWRSVELLPPGLSAAWLIDFHARFTDKAHYRQQLGPCLALLLAAAEPLRRVDLARLQGLTVSALQDRLDEFGALITTLGDQVHITQHALQTWLQDAARSSPFSVSAIDGHQALADEGWALLPSGAQALPGYYQRHLPRHLKATEQHDRLQTCVTDAGFIALACAQHRVFALAEHWRQRSPGVLAALCANSLARLAASTPDPMVIHHANKGIGQLFQQLGQYGLAIGWLQQALAAAEGVRDDSTLGYAHLAIAWCMRHSEQYAAAIGHASHAMEHFEAADNAEGQARAQSVIGLCHWHLHDDERALAHLRTSATLYRDVHDAAGLAETLNHLGIVCRSLGLYDEALEKLQASELLYRRHHDEKGLGKCLNSQGTTHWWRGDLRTAMHCWRQANLINRRIAQPYVRGLTANNLGYVLLARGQARRALSAFRGARAIRRALGSHGYEMMDLSGMALAALGLGRLDDARRWSRQALAGLQGQADVEDIERAFLNHHTILRDGTPAERAEGLQALRQAETWVRARISRLRDASLQARISSSVPTVRAVLAAAVESAAAA